MLAGQLGIIAGVLVVYLLVARIASSRAERAVGHGGALLSAERWLHVDIESAANHWLAGRGVLSTLANYHYAIAYVVSTFAALGWLYWCRPEHYLGARDRLLVITCAGIAVFALYPVAPPRLLPGFVDTVADGGTWGSWGTGLISNQANNYAALPSLHVAWTAWVAVEVVAAGARRWVSVLAGVDGLLTAAVVVATANHYLLDVVAGLLLVQLARGGRGRLRGLIARRAVATEVALFALVSAGCTLAGLLARGDLEAARANGQQIWRAQRWLHLDVPWYDAAAHYGWTALVLVWLWRRHHGVYRRARRALVATSVIGMAVFVLYPTVPPGAASARGAAGLTGQLAAVPSLHVAWACWCAYWVMRCVPPGRRRWVAVLLALVATLVVIDTGYHHPLGALAGLAAWVAGEGTIVGWSRWRAAPAPRPRDAGAAHDLVTSEVGRR